jgi:hypothetical protein
LFSSIRAAPHKSCIGCHASIDIPLCSRQDARVESHTAQAPLDSSRCCNPFDLNRRGAREMKKIIVALSLSVAALPVFAQAKPCEELKAEIAAKLEAKGVVGYTLEIVANDQVPQGAKVVGTCEGGTKKITYKRGG